MNKPPDRIHTDLNYYHHRLVNLVAVAEGTVYNFICMCVLYTLGTVPLPYFIVGEGIQITADGVLIFVTQKDLLFM